VIERRRLACRCATLLEGRLTIQSGMNASVVVAGAESIQPLLVVAA
jgi:hypothetical protein